MLIYLGEKQKYNDKFVVLSFLYNVKKNLSKAGKYMQFSQLSKKKLVH